MRMRAIQYGLLGLSACTQANPAFVPDDETGLLVIDESDDEQDGSEASEASEEEGGECWLGPTDSPLEIRFDHPCGVNANVGGVEIYDYFVDVATVDGSTMTGFLCLEPGCESQCDGMTPIEFDVVPLPLDQVFGAGACVHVRANQHVDSPACEYQTLAMWFGDDIAPSVVARSRDNLPLPLTQGAESIAAFSPTLVEVDSCACQDYPESCCDGVDNPPTEYAFDLPGLPEPVPIGDVEALDLGIASYDFWALDAFTGGGCDARAHVDWALIKQ